MRKYLRHLLDPCVDADSVKDSQTGAKSFLKSFYMGKTVILFLLRLFLKQDNLNNVVVVNGFNSSTSSYGQHYLPKWSMNIRAGNAANMVPRAYQTAKLVNIFIERFFTDRKVNSRYCWFRTAFPTPIQENCITVNGGVYRKWYKRGQRSYLKG
jgi:hypothetical protein